MYTDPQILDTVTRYECWTPLFHALVSSLHGYCKFTGHGITLYTDHCYYMYYHRDITRIIATHICSPGTRIYQCTDYRISYYCYHRYMDSRHITVTHACMVSIFLSYRSPFILHVILMYSCYMIVSRYCYCYSRYWIHEPLICDVWNPTSIISRFPLSCFVLSTELMLCYRVTCTISCTCSWYTV